MTLTLYNSLSQKKEPFIPLTPGQVSMYVCGVTLYDFCHIGHARAYVVFDCLYRILKREGYRVNYVQNFTDIDDKIIKRSLEQDIPYTDLTATYKEKYFEDMDALNIKRATAYPCATQHIGQMIGMIQKLIQKGYAYVAQDHVYFSIQKFKSYGSLSKKNIEDLIAGMRVAIQDQKKAPLDFVLWKPSKKNEPSWKSPWGAGRPGWHIECSAMAQTQLGNSIDIHGGGEDLMFPHHENEIAQSECSSGKPFAKVWIHNGFVTIKNEKMSKSLNNFYTIREILKDFSGEILRFYLMQVHYRSPLKFSITGIQASGQALTRLHHTLEKITHTEVASHPADFIDLQARYYGALQNDLNTAEAIGYLFEINKLILASQSGSQVLLDCGQSIGLFKGITLQKNYPAALLALIQKRQDARQKKDFGLSDQLRDQVAAQFGYQIEDTPHGVQLHKT